MYVPVFSMKPSNFDETRYNDTVASVLQCRCSVVEVVLQFGWCSVAVLLPVCCKFQHACNTYVWWSCDLCIEIVKVLQQSNAFVPLFHNGVPTTSYKFVGDCIMEKHCFSHTAHPCHTITSHDNHSYLA